MHIFFSVGEPSGDQHAAALIGELKQRSPGVRITGFGGPRMKQAGSEQLYPLVDLAVMGFLRVLPLLLTFYRLVKQAEAFFDREHPDAVVLIDNPGFNWWIARKAKKRGIRVFYYMPPQMWAWAPWRVAKVRRFVDHIISGLSFEVEWYRQRGVACEFVGHPFFDEVSHRPLDGDYMTSLTDVDGPLVGLLPGSRAHEVQANFPVMVNVLQQLHASHPEARFQVACYKESQRTMCLDMLSDAARENPAVSQIPVELAVGRTSEIIESSDCCLVVSGSVSLELLGRRKPAVVLYHASLWLMILRRIFVNCQYVTLPNLMAGREIMPEFVFSGPDTEPVKQISGILNRWISDDMDRLTSIKELDGLANDVAQPGGTIRTAEFILSQFEQQRVAKAA